ncbi:Loki-CTERM sorting domain-containing protein [Oceanobacillus kapialis]
MIAEMNWLDAGFQIFFLLFIIAIITLIVKWRKNKKR